jgi:transcriptional regulator with XRE-family HTH domain
MKTSKATISAYENDKIDIKSSTLIELSDNLGSTPDVLLGYRSPIDRDISKRRIVVLRGLTGEEAKRLVGMLLDSFEVFLDYKPGNNSDDSIENI